MEGISKELRSALRAKASFRLACEFKARTKRNFGMSLFSRAKDLHQCRKLISVIRNLDKETE